MKTVDPAGAAEPGSQMGFQVSGHRSGAWTVHQDHRDELRRMEPRNVQRMLVEQIVLLAITVTVAAIAAPFGYAWVAFGISFLCGAGGLMARHRDDDRRELCKEVLLMRDDFGAGPSWTVDLIVRQGEAPTGRDQGLMWVEGGRVLFSGKRTSFAISPDQIASPIRHEMAVRDLRLRLNLDLKAATSAGAVSLSFWPIADSFRRAEEDASAMRYAFNTILANGRWTVAPPIAGQWPPLELGPGALSPSKALHSIRIRVALWFVGAALFCAPVAMAFPLLGLLEFVFLGGMVVVLNKNDFTIRNRAYRSAQKAWGAV